MIAAIVLAAGESRRMGKQKLLLPYGGKTVIARVIDNILASDIDRTIVVTGHDHAAVRQALGERQVQLTQNTSYRDGMLSSIRRGMAELGEDVAAYLIVLGDQPDIPPATVNTLLSRFAASDSNIVSPTFGGKPGHPIVVPARFREAVMTKYDGIGLRGLLHEYAACVAYCPIDTNAILFDMDTEADYKRALAQWDEVSDETD